MDSRHLQETTDRVRVYLVGGDEVEGDLHVPRHARMLDILNHQADARPFIALTDVTWTRAGASSQVPFVCLNRAQIIAVRPVG